MLRIRGRRERGMSYFTKLQASHFSAENQDVGYDLAMSKARGELCLGRLCALEQPVQEPGSM